MRQESLLKIESEGKNERRTYAPSGTKRTNDDELKVLEGLNKRSIKGVNSGAPNDCFL